jgi:hypothetical protein
LDVLSDGLGGGVVVGVLIELFVLLDYGDGYDADRVAEGVPTGGVGECVLQFLYKINREVRRFDRF